MKKDSTIKALSSEQESFYEEALNEMNTGERRPGIYAKALADSMGDEKKVDSLYLELLAQSLMEEAERIEAERIAEEERIEAERIAEEERIEAERLEAERIAEEERIEAERLEAERIAEEERIWNERLADETRKLKNKMVPSDLIKGFLLFIFLVIAIIFLLLLAGPSSV